MKSKNKTKPQKNNINEFVNINSQQNMNRFKNKSQTSEVIDGEYEIIKDSENKKNQLFVLMCFDTFVLRSYATIPPLEVDKPVKAKILTQ